VRIRLWHWPEKGEFQWSQQELTMAKVQGEGNYAAAKRFNAEEKAFVKSGKVEQAAASAAPKSKKEAQELLAAEKIAKAHPKNKASQRHQQVDDDAPAQGTSRDQMQP
jgi:hypothetical protein